MATVLTDAQLPHVHEGVVVGRLLVEREQLGERAAHEVDEGPRAGAGELAVLDVGQVHRLRGALVHRGLVEPREPDEAEKREDPDPLVLVCAPPLDEQPRQLFATLGQRREEWQHDVHVLHQRRRHRRLAEDGQQAHQLQRVRLERPGARFNINMFGLSFGLQYGLRFLFDAVTCVK